MVKASQGTIESLNVILAKMNAIVDNLQTGKGSVGQLINNPDLYNKANATVDELPKLAQNLNSGKGIDRQADERRYDVQPAERNGGASWRASLMRLQSGQGYGGQAAEGRVAVQESELDAGAGEPADDGRESGQGRDRAAAEGSEVPGAA